MSDGTNGRDLFDIPLITIETITFSRMTPAPLLLEWDGNKPKNSPYTINRIVTDNEHPRGSTYGILRKRLFDSIVEENTGAYCELPKPVILGCSVPEVAPYFSIKDESSTNVGKFETSLFPIFAHKGPSRIITHPCCYA